MAGRDHYKRILRLHLPPTSRDCSLTLNSSGCCAIDDGVLTGKLEKKNSGNASNCRGIGQEGILFFFSPLSVPNGNYLVYNCCLLFKTHFMGISGGKTGGNGGA